MMNSRIRSSLQQRSSGFTLIELMIAVAIIGILAAIAYPSYQSSVVRSNRADAQQTLVQAAQSMERWYATNGACGYSKSAAADGTCTGTAAPIPSKSPASGTTVYTITFQGTPTTGAFTVRATPVTTGVNKSDGYLEISNTGVKGWDRDNNGDTNGTNEKNWNR